MDHGFQDLLFLLKKQFLEIESVNFFKWYQKIPLEKYLSHQFFQSDEKNMAIDSNIKIIQVTNQNAQWRLELESTNEAEFTVYKSALILDENYNVIEVLGDAALKK